MPKHKKDKRTKSISQPFHSENAAHPTVVGTPHAAEGEGIGSNAFQQHDLNRRLGDYEGAGNHARTGNRGHQ
jgi:hypothetical protein